MAVVLNSATDLEGLPSGPLKDSAYNAMDCCITHELLGVLRAQLDPVTAATYEFTKLLQAPSLDMMLRGILVDDERRQMIADDMRRKIAVVEHNLRRLIGESFDVDASGFNYNSNKDVLWLFYDIMELPPILNDERKPTCDKTALGKLQRYPFAKPFCLHLLALRESNKLLGVLKTPIDDDGRMRCTLSIVGTETGRYASYSSAFGRGTNLQNADPETRYAYIADPGKKFAYIDLEQAEARAVGAKVFSLFGDSSYLDACESGDLHTRVALMTWPHLRTKEDCKRIFHRSFSYRETAKRLGHGTSYLGSASHMARELNIPLPLVEEFQRKFFAIFPGIKRWHQWVVQQLALKGYIISLTGRRRYFLDRRDSDDTVGEAVAYDPQETVARLLNQGMFKLWHHAATGRLDIQLLLQVHDATLIQYDWQREQELLPRCLELIRVPLRLTAPNGTKRTLIIPSEAKVGFNWGARHKLDANNTEYEFDPDGLTKFDPNRPDTRRRYFDPSVSIIDRPRRQYPSIAAVAA